MKKETNMNVTKEEYIHLAKKDCINAEERSDGVGSQQSITHHFFCKKFLIPITEPIENSFVKVPLTPRKQIGTKYYESGWWLWRKKAVIPIFEYNHPCDNCIFYQLTFKDSA